MFEKFLGQSNLMAYIMPNLFSWYLELPTQQAKAIGLTLATVSPRICTGLQWPVSARWPFAHWVYKSLAIWIVRLSTLQLVTVITAAPTHMQVYAVSFWFSLCFLTCTENWCCDEHCRCVLVSLLLQAAYILSLAQPTAGDMLAVIAQGWACMNAYRNPLLIGQSWLTSCCSFANGYKTGQCSHQKYSVIQAFLWNQSSASNILHCLNRWKLHSYFMIGLCLYSIG